MFLDGECNIVALLPSVVGVVSEQGDMDCVVSCEGSDISVGCVVSEVCGAGVVVSHAASLFWLGHRQQRYVSASKLAMASG